MIDPSGVAINLLKRAAGIGGAQAEARIFAKATKSVVDAAVTEVKDHLPSRYILRATPQCTSLWSRPSRWKSHNRDATGGNTELLQKKGNNDDAQVIRDAVSDMGMVVDETTGLFYEPQRDNDGRVVIVNGRPVADMSRQITDTSGSRTSTWLAAVLRWCSKWLTSQPKSHYLGTDKGDGEAGTLLSTIKGGFITWCTWW